MGTESAVSQLQQERATGADTAQNTITSPVSRRQRLWHDMTMVILI